MTKSKSLARIQQDPVTIFPKIPNVKRLPEFFQFAQWLATPSDKREYKTQKDFAASIRIDEDTLTSWKARPELWAMTQSAIRGWMREMTADVIGSLADRAAGEGKAPEVALFLRIAGFMDIKKQK